MRLAVYLFFIILLTFLSCSDDPTKFKSRKIIDREEFIEILIDIHLMDAVSNDPDYFRKYRDIDSIDLYSQIFEKHHVTQALFDSTVSAYTRRPDLYKEVYDEVLLKLNMQLDELRDLSNQMKEEQEDSRVNSPDQ